MHSYNFVCDFVYIQERLALFHWPPELENT